jgi:NitT/TauT family transport system substrate-binding protein
MIVRKKRNLTIIATTTLITAVIFSSLVYLNFQTQPKVKYDSVIIGNAQSFECDTLVYIAQQQNYFQQNHLNVTIANYTSGAAAVVDLLAGKLDIAATAEFPLVINAMKGEKISALACIGRFELQDLIARKDRGIKSISDLAGKTIGVPLGTVAQFYLGRFLELNGLSLDEVTTVNVNPANAIDSIVNGTLDAVVIWQPYAYAIENRLGSNAIVWSPQSSQSTFIAEVANNNWIVQNPDISKRFIQSLSQAEDYYNNNPSETKTMIQTRLNYSDGYMTAVWPKQQISLFLDQSFVLAMQDESRWLISNNLTNATSAPNFLNCICSEGLDAVKPQSNNLIK